MNSSAMCSIHPRFRFSALLKVSNFHCSPKKQSARFEIRHRTDAAGGGGGGCLRDAFAFSHPHSRLVWNQQLLWGVGVLKNSLHAEIIIVLFFHHKTLPLSSVGKWERACVFSTRSEEKDQQLVPQRVSHFIYYNCARVSGFLLGNEEILIYYYWLWRMGGSPGINMQSGSSFIQPLNSK